MTAQLTRETDEIPVLDPNIGPRTATAPKAGYPAVAAALPVMDTRRRLRHVVLPTQMAMTAKVLSTITIPRARAPETAISRLPLRPVANTPLARPPFGEAIQPAAVLAPR